MIVERRLSAHFDWPLLAALLSLTLIGLGTIYSVTWDPRPGHNQAGPEFWVQVYALPVGLAALGACLLVDYRTLAQRWLWFYAAILIGLLYVRFNGHVSGGAGRWIRVGRISLQPSEFARMTIALVLAMFYGESRRTAKSMWELAGGAALVAIPTYLILKQPDFGTAVTLGPVYLGVVFMAGLRVKWKAKTRFRLSVLKT